MGPRVYRLCTLFLVLMEFGDAKESNIEIYNQRNTLNPNLGHHQNNNNNNIIDEEVQNNPTSLIIRGDNEKNNSNGSSSSLWADNNHGNKGLESRQFQDVEKVRPRINSSNGAERSKIHYNGEELRAWKSSDAELVPVDEDDEVLMNDGFYDVDGEVDEKTTPPPPAGTMPVFLTGHRSQEPNFDPSTKKNVTALVGKSAYLNCRVRNLGNKTVSWIRHRDIHILTVGSYTYTSDQRFQATHHKETEDWILQIKWVQKRDAGKYECQVSTQPVQSYFVNLEVVVPTAYIIGGQDMHVDKGSTINLTCSVRYSPEPPAYIFWFHHEEVISYDSNRGGVSVITEKGDVTTSNLLIVNANLADSGKYSCSPSNADVASVRVHVINGEHPEAMQTAAATASYQLTYFSVILPLILTVFGVLLQRERHFFAVNFNNGNVIDALTMANIDGAGAAAKIGTFNNVALISSSSATSTECRRGRRRTR